MQFDNKIPIYLQFIDDIKNKIISGELKPGTRIPSVRDYSDIYKINPNTVQKSLEKLELEKLVYTNRTSGRFITEDLSVIEKLKTNSLKNEIEKFIKSLKSKNFTQTEVEMMFKELIERYDNE